MNADGNIIFRSLFIAHRSAFPTPVDFLSILLVKQRSSV